MKRNYLATYRDGINWCFNWFEDEAETLDWIDNDADRYSEVEVVELRVVNVLYKDGFRII